MSLARRHRDRCLATASAAAAALAPEQRGPEGPEATAYELMRAQLGQDLAKLREIQSTEGKIGLKCDLIPNYYAWCAGVLDAVAAEGATGAQDDVVAQIMIWAIDVEDYRLALDLAAYVLRWKVELPSRFERTAGCVVAEQIAENALKTLGAGDAFDLAVLLEADDLTAGEDMPDQVRAKLAKAIGLELARAADAIEAGADGPAGAKRAATEGAISRLRRALELDPKAGVKKQVERLERERIKLAAGDEGGA
ncbi:MAG: terminase [Alphaproteobacteria bacterium]|nr:MAG: terminase [Alphaproteobacteria bacterium]